jgi:hypothetical protein
MPRSARSRSCLVGASLRRVRTCDGNTAISLTAWECTQLPRVRPPSRIGIKGSFVWGFIDSCRRPCWPMPPAGA